MLRSGVGALLQGEGPVSLSLRPDQLIAHWLMQFIAACHPKRARDVEPFLAELGRQGLAHHAKAATRIGYKVQFEGILEAVGKRLPVGELQHEAARAVELVVRAQVLSRAELLALELALNSETCQGAGATISRNGHVNI